MPNLSPADSLILFADLQHEIVGRSATNPEKTIRRSAGALAVFARETGIPALASVVRFGTEHPKPIGEIGDALPDIPIFPRGGPAVFAHGPTRAAVAATGRRSLLIAGVASEVVVLHAAVAARESGMAVFVLLDACGGFSARTEDAAIREIERAGGVATSVASFATGTVEEFGTSDGQAAMKALRSLMG